MKKFLAGCGLALSFCLIIGCTPYSSLPVIRVDKLPLTVREIPADTTPLYSWRAEHPKLFTYWGKQSVTVSATAYFPDDWQVAGDEFWRVGAMNGEGKPLPFVGVIRRYVNENGTRLGVVVPSVDLEHMPDGLYIVIDPKVTLEEGKIVRIEPVAIVTEIRDHHFTPFQFALPLIPDVPSDMIPLPPPPPEIPEGTPIAVN